LQTTELSLGLSAGFAVESQNFLPRRSGFFTETDGKETTTMLQIVEWPLVC
jgi:hypothetical protein